MIRLSREGRPTEVDAWAKNSKDPHINVTDTAQFGTSWIAWWTGCQPAARSPNSGWPLLQAEMDRSDWGKMLHGGKNGIFLFVMAMSWWINDADISDPSSNLSSAIADLKWVLEQLNSCLSPPPTLPTPPSPPQLTLGKCNIRLTQRASDAPTEMKKMFTH